jgi:hypothetical protein
LLICLRNVEQAAAAMRCALWLLVLFIRPINQPTDICSNEIHGGIHASHSPEITWFAVALLLSGL